MFEEFVRVEDRNFYRHLGVSPTGIIRALIANIKARRVAQGGSTINQQLVKLSYKFPNRWVRKCAELFMAPYLTIVKGRRWILDQYMNKVYFGNNIYGIRKAAIYYFHKPFYQLSKSENLILACLLSRPDYWLKHLDQLRTKAMLYVKRDQLDISESTLNNRVM
jgi:membrane peptidoglycan carboxypeptidase